MACLVGTFYDQGSSRCRPCAEGSYQDKEGQSVCTVCGEGKSTSITGATSSKDCSNGNVKNIRLCKLKDLGNLLEVVCLTRFFNALKHNLLQEAGWLAGWHPFVSR